MERESVPDLEPTHHGLSAADLDTTFQTGNVFLGREEATLREIVEAGGAALVINETNIDLVEGQAEYHFFRSAADDTSDSNRAQATTNQTASTIFGIDDILEATYRTNRTQTSQQDVAMTKINRSTYSGLANKLTKAQPTQYYVQRLIDRVTLFVYPTPDSTAGAADMHLYFVKRIQDAGDFTNASDIPYRFVPCMVSGLTFYLSQKYRPELAQQMKLYYEDEFNRALTEDGSSTSTHITPQAYYPNV